MYLVAIHGLKGDHEMLARRLAAVLGTTVLEALARVRAPGGGPAVVGRFAEPGSAEARAAMLCERGFAAMVLRPEEIESDRGRFVARSFELGGYRLAAHSQGGCLEIPYEDVRLLLRGTTITTETEIKTTKERVFSPTRLILSGGLVLTKKVTTSRELVTEERHDFLHLYAPGRPTLAMHEGLLNYGSLGGQIQPSRAGNFKLLLAELKRRCPAALQDERLASRGGLSQLLGPALSPDRDLDAAVSLLAKYLLTTPVPVWQTS